MIEKIAKDLAEVAHHMLLQGNQDESLDGDATEYFAKLFLKELDKLNGNT